MVRVPAAGAIARFTPVATDAAGNAAQVEGITVTLSDNRFGTAAQGSDGDIRFTPSGLLGTVTLQAQADALVGEGEELLTASVEIEVVAGKAAFFSLGNGVVEATV